MKEEMIGEEKKELIQLCKEVREMVNVRNYEKCNQVIKEAMGKYPHSPEPHNLLGMLLEREDNHLLAMKHFRVAWALDPTYLPARHNLELYGTFFSKGQGAFDESDCPVLIEDNTHKVNYDKNGVGHINRRGNIEIT